MNNIKSSYFHLSFIMFGLLLFSCKSDKIIDNKVSETNLLSIRVKTQKVISKDDNSIINSLGMVMSETESKPSFKTGGIIKATFVKEGDLVKRGQVLATLIMDEIDAQVKQAEEAFQKAERDVDRIKSLFSDSVATMEQVQNLTTAYIISKKNVEIAKFNKVNSTIKSPVNGKIIKQIMFQGEIVGPGNPIFMIMGVGSKDWIIRTGLIDFEWAMTNIGDKASITFDAYPGRTFSGHVSKKSSLGVNSSGTFDIEIKMDSQPNQLAAGIVARTTIYTKTKNVLQIIPLESVVKSNGNYAEVFTIINNKAKKLQLKIHKLLGDQMAIAEGLENVDSVVTIGAMYLEDGDMVITH